jgi:hypothetical protein
VKAWTLAHLGKPGIGYVVTPRQELHHDLLGERSARNLPRHTETQADNANHKTTLPLPGASRKCHSKHGSLPGLLSQRTDGGAWQSGDDHDERDFYLRLAEQNGWNVRELARQIDADLFERALLAPLQLSTALREMYPSAGEVSEMLTC